jgi:stage III sporulation protein AG
MEKWRKICGKIGRDRFLILIIGGLLLLVITYPLPSSAEDGTIENQSSTRENSSTGSKQNAEALSEENSDNTVETSTLENQLAGILSSIYGAGKVKVMITYADDGMKVVEKDTDDTSDETVYTFDENENQVPFVSRIIAPKVQGVLVVAEGGGNLEVETEMKESIMALFGIEEHKIKVVKMKGESK